MKPLILILDMPKNNVGTIDQQVTLYIGIGKTTQTKFSFKVDDIIFSEFLPVPYPDMELVAGTH
jgi:hypothetical protein